MMRVEQLCFYPVKSLRASEATELFIDDRGPRYDRHWMLVDADGLFLTQRREPRLATLTPRLGATLRIEGPGPGVLELPLTGDGPRRKVTVWSDILEAVDCGDEAAAFLSERLQQPCRLVRMADDVVRPLDRTWKPREGAHTGFADAYPLLLTNLASLDELNRRLAAPVPMNRFRPNVVVRAAEPWAEDGWAALRLGALEVDVVKPCSRCVTIATDQHSGHRFAEPLRTLAGYRTRPGLGAVFGSNVVHRTTGRIAVGDEVFVL